MSHELDVSARITAQIALLQSVTPRLRAVSLDITSTALSCRFEYDGTPSDDEKELGSNVIGEIISAFPSLKTINEEYLARPMPYRIDHLRLLVYRRCEGNGIIWPA